MELKPIPIETEEGRNRRQPPTPPENSSLSDAFADAVLETGFVRRSVRKMADTLIHNEHDEATSDLAYGWRQQVLNGGAKGLGAAAKITMKYVF